ncbi:MAG: hypothetical protein A2Y62_19770 [Candidatus Fischerbacteria bacterium RBG_13_37_8]|uniref:Uncharacterized protein n=1 Tax=Candidatus Fischerbacteria bacterium RBG_13_37_8 TaxID=1817863 RepID=A0A1F5VL15_9BACT|nr:MAG: hypothetical protein A2Y62_19770 [Candidatus Fischerbacteria bacterium RBG_13_37_8]
MQQGCENDPLHSYKDPMKYELADEFRQLVLLAQQDITLEEWEKANHTDYELIHRNIPSGTLEERWCHKTTITGPLWKAEYMFYEDDKQKTCTLQQALLFIYTIDVSMIEELTYSAEKVLGKATILTVAQYRKIKYWSPQSATVSSWTSPHAESYLYYLTGWGICARDDFNFDSDGGKQYIEWQKVEKDYNRISRTNCFILHMLISPLLDEKRKTESIK